MAAKATSSIQVIARASRLLDALAAHDEPLNLKTLASMTGLHPSTAFRILASLIEHGFVERSVDGQYRLGGRLQQLGSRAADRFELRRDLHPFIERQREPAGEF